MGTDEKACISLVSRFFNEIVKENSSRAVRGEPPADFEKARAKYTRIVMAVFPTLAHLAGGGNSAAGSAAKGGQASGSHGGNQGGNQRGRRGGQQFGGSAGSGAGNGGLNAPKAVHNNRPVCFNFNPVGGCGRRQGASDACLGPKGALFAHYCNFYDKSSGSFCLLQHPRVQFH